MKHTFLDAVVIIKGDCRVKVGNLSIRIPMEKELHSRNEVAHFVVDELVKIRNRHEIGTKWFIFYNKVIGNFTPFL